MFILGPHPWSRRQIRAHQRASEELKRAQTRMLDAIESDFFLYDADDRLVLYPTGARTKVLLSSSPIRGH